MNIAERVQMALIAGSSGLRVFHNRLPSPGKPEYVLPMVVINEITGHDEYDLRSVDGLRRRIMRVDVWASGRKAADDHMETAIGLMNAATTFRVAGSEPSGAPGYDDEANLYRASVDFTVWFAQ